MAILANGQVLLTGDPQEAIAALQGRVWRKPVSKESLEGYRKSFQVLSSRLVSGRPMIHVYSETKPEDGFEQVAPGLEDVYFQRLRNGVAVAA
jgi:hypothetical protein